MAERLTRAESTARTRSRLIEEASGRFYERGYAATSMEEVASAAGVTKGAIYRHFASKEDLFLAVLEAKGQRPDLSILEDEDLSLADRFEALGRTLCTGPTDVLATAMQLEHRAALLRRPEARAPFADLLRNAIADLHVVSQDEPHPNDALALLLGQVFIDGLDFYAELLPDLVTNEAYAKTFRLLAGLYEDVDEA